MDIYVLIPSGKTITVECDEGDTFLEIETHICDRHYISGSLTFNEIILEKNDKITLEYHDKYFGFIEKK